jgi:hypothetical protein
MGHIMSINVEIGSINSRLIQIGNSLQQNINNSSNNSNEIPSFTSKKATLMTRSTHISSSLKKIQDLIKETPRLRECFDVLNRSWIDFYNQLATELKESKAVPSNELTEKIKTATNSLTIFQQKVSGKSSDSMLPKPTTSLSKMELDDDDDDDKKIALLRKPHIQSLLIPEMKTKYEATFKTFPLLLEICKQLIDKILDGEFGALKDALLTKDGSVITAQPFIKLLIIFYIKQENPEFDIKQENSKKDKDALFINELFQETSNKSNIFGIIKFLKNKKAAFSNKVIEEYFLDTSGMALLPHTEIFHTFLLPASKFTNADNTSKKLYSDFQEAISSYYSPSVDLILAAALKVDPNNQMLVRNLFDLLDKTKKKEAMELGISTLRTDKLDVTNIAKDQSDNLLFAVVPFIALHDVKKAFSIIKHITHDHLRGVALTKIIRLTEHDDAVDLIEPVLEYILSDQVRPKENADTFFSKVYSDILFPEIPHCAKTVIVKNPDIFLLSIIRELMKESPTRKQIEDLSQNPDFQAAFTKSYTNHLKVHGADPHTVQSFIESDAKSSLFGEFLWTKYYASNAILARECLVQPNFTPAIFEKILEYPEQCAKKITHPLFKALLLKNVFSNFLSKYNSEIGGIEELYKATNNAQEFNSATLLKSSNHTTLSAFLAKIVKQIELYGSSYLYAKTLNRFASFCLMQTYNTEVEISKELEFKFYALKELFHKKSKEFCETVYFKKLVHLAVLEALNNLSLACDMLKELESNNTMLDMALNKILVDLIEFNEWDNIQRLNEYLDNFSNQVIVEKYQKIISGLKVTESYLFYTPDPDFSSDSDSDSDADPRLDNDHVHSSGSNDEQALQSTKGVQHTSTSSSDSEIKLSSSKNIKVFSSIDISDEKDTMPLIEEKAISKSKQSKRSLSSSSEDEQTVPRAKRVKQIIPPNAGLETSSDDEKDTRNS